VHLIHHSGYASTVISLSTLTLSKYEENFIFNKEENQNTKRHLSDKIIWQKGKNTA